MDQIVIENIEELINVRGLKKKAVADKIGLTAPQFSDLLNGRRTIKADLLPSLCEVLNVTPNELFGWKTKTPAKAGRE